MTVHFRSDSIFDTVYEMFLFAIFKMEAVVIGCDILLSQKWLFEFNTHVVCWAGYIHWKKPLETLVIKWDLLAD